MTPSLQKPSQKKGPRVFVLDGGSRPDTMGWHVMDSLRALGCEAEAFDVRTVFPNWFVGDRIVRKLAVSLLREPDRLRERTLLRRIHEFAPDLVLVLIAKEVTAWTIAEIRKVTKAPVVAWFQDALVAFGRQHVLAAEYDTVFLKDKYLTRLFSKMIDSTRFHYLPEACNGRVHRPVELSAGERERYRCDVMIAGTLYYYRQEILRRLDHRNLKIWGGRAGTGWMMNKLKSRHMGREVFADDKARAVAGAVISLNTLHFAEVESLNCRAFELAGCGGCQFINSTPALAEHFEVGREIVTFDSLDELAEKTEYYLAHEDEAKEIGRRASLRAHRDHTYERRLEEIFRVALA